MYETYVLVTGGSGFIGTNLCLKLLQEGYSVISIDNHITSPRGQEVFCMCYQQFRFLLHDITYGIPAELLPKNISIQTIYHLACPTGVPNITVLGEEMIATCSIGTKNILELALQHNADVVFTSSSEVYGNPQVFPQTESYTGNVSPTGMRSPYEEGKRFAETLTTFYVKKYQLQAKIIRLFNTYGPYMSHDDTRIIPKFIQLLKKSLPLTIEGNGKQTRTFCYIDDIIHGIRTVQEKGTTGQVYNLGADREITMHALAAILLSLTPHNSGVTFIPRVSEDHDRRIPCLEKMYALGWKPNIALAEGLRRTLQWYGLSA